MENKISYDELELLVTAYQDGSSDAADTLAKQFKGYFNQYLKVLCAQNFDLYSDTQRNFAKQFIKDKKTRDNVNRYYKRSPYIQKTVYKTVQNIRYQTSFLPKEDWLSEIKYLFFSMVGSHNHQAPFQIFLTKYFHLKFAKRVQKICKDYRDVLTFEVSYEENDIMTAHFDRYTLEEEPSRYHILSTDPTEFDENWVNGFECGEWFRYFTPYERRLLKWYYEWKTLPPMLPEDIHKERKQRFKRKDDEIADLLGCSRKTVNIKRNEIKAELECIARRLHLLQGNQPSTTSRT